MRLNQACRLGPDSPSLCAPYLQCNETSNPGVCVPKFPLGAPCSVDSQCQSNLWCPAYSKVCTNKLASGTCSANNQCITGNCTRWKSCIEAPSCANYVGNQYPCGPGYYCRLATGYCEQKLDIGTPCFDPFQCKSNICNILPNNAYGYCAQCTSANEWQVCGINQYCDVNAAIPVCSPARGSNSQCDINRQCLSGLCLNGICTYTGKCLETGACFLPSNIQTGWCAIPSQPNPPIVILVPRPICPSPSWCGGNSLAPIGFDNTCGNTCGSSCGSPCQSAPFPWGPYPWFSDVYPCASPFDVVVLPSPPLPINPFPAWTFGTCQPLLPQFAPCTISGQCDGANWCSPSLFICVPFCSGYATSQGVLCPAGWACPRNDASLFAIDCIAQRGTACSTDAVCATGLVCNSLYGNTCAPPNAPGQRCTRNGECDSTSVCASGICTLFNPSEFCVFDNQCYSGLCNLLTHKCIRSPQVLASPCARNAECASGKCSSSTNTCL